MTESFVVHTNQISYKVNDHVLEIYPYSSKRQQIKPKPKAMVQEESRKDAQLIYQWLLASEEPSRLQVIALSSLSGVKDAVRLIIRTISLSNMRLVELELFRCSTDLESLKRLLQPGALNLEHLEVLRLGIRVATNQPVGFLPTLLYRAKMLKELCLKMDFSDAAIVKRFLNVSYRLPALKIMKMEVDYDRRKKELLKIPIVPKYIKLYEKSLKTMPELKLTTNERWKINNSEII